jgi:anti-anti-sigma factor
MFMAFASLPPADPFGVTVDVEQHGPTVVLRVVGELDLLTTPTLSEACTVALASKPPMLVIDLNAVTFLASVGMSAIVATQQAAGEHTKLRVVGGSRDILRPIAVTGLDTLLSVYPTLAEALADS